MNSLEFSGNRLPSQHVADFDLLLSRVLTATVKPRPYTARISRENPTAFVFLLDQSGSMEAEFATPNGSFRKSAFLADAVNGLLNQLVTECRRAGEYRNYFDVCVIGYGGDEDNTAKYAWEGALKGRGFVTIGELLAHPLSMNGSKRVWITETAERLTPMNQAISLARDTLVQWLATKAGKDIFPPMVINITDGHATDASATELVQAANQLKALQTADGSVLFFNIHLSDSGDNAVLFPCRKSDLPDDEYARTLFDMSSDLPAIFNTHVARMTQRELIDAYTAMAFNVNPIQMVQLLNIGTSVSRNRV